MVANAEPSVEAVYHNGLVPFVAKLATVGFAAEQKACGVVGVGALGVELTVIDLVAVAVPQLPPLVVRVKVIEPLSLALAV